MALIQWCSRVNVSFLMGPNGMSRQIRDYISCALVIDSYITIIKSEQTFPFCLYVVTKLPPLQPLRSLQATRGRYIFPQSDIKTTIGSLKTDTYRKDSGISLLYLSITVPSFLSDNSPEKLAKPLLLPKLRHARLLFWYLYLKLKILGNFLFECNERPYKPCCVNPHKQI